MAASYGPTRAIRGLCVKALTAGGGTRVLAEHALEGARMGGHRAIHAHVDQAAPGGRRVAVVVREPVLPGVAVAMGTCHVVGCRDLEGLGAEAVGDRHLEGNDAR